MKTTYLYAASFALIVYAHHGPEGAAWALFLFACIHDLIDGLAKWTKRRKADKALHRLREAVAVLRRAREAVKTTPAAKPVETFTTHQAPPRGAKGH